MDSSDKNIIEGLENPTSVALSGIRMDDNSKKMVAIFRDIICSKLGSEYKGNHFQENFPVAWKLMQAENSKT